MRHSSSQLPPTAPWTLRAHAEELTAMSALLKEQPALAALIQQDLEAGWRTNPHRASEKVPSKPLQE
jgi:hypothetical protein